MEYAIGVDLGGTNIAAGIVNNKGNVILREKIPTLAKAGGKKVVGRIQQLISTLLKNADPKIRKNIKGIGIGTPGLVEHKAGIVREPPNLPGMNNMNLKKIMQNKFRIPTFIANDANAYAIGEHTFGAGKGASNMICITLGTGVGGGVILNNKLFVGSFETAGELGHITIYKDGKKCLCGNTGCVEAYIGANFLSDRVRKDISAGKKSKISKLVDGDLSKITPRVLSNAAKAGDKYAKEMWERIGQELAAALISISNMYGPERIVIGGGVSNAGKFLFKPLIKEFKKRSFKYLSTRVKIVPESSLMMQGS